MSDEPKPPKPCHVVDLEAVLRRLPSPIVIVFCAQLLAEQEPVQPEAHDCPGCVAVAPKVAQLINLAREIQDELKAELERHRAARRPIDPRMN